MLNPFEVEKRLSDFLNVNIDINSISKAKLSSLGRSNSSFNDSFEGLSRAPLTRWKNSTEVNVVDSIEYIVGEKCMKRYGYKKFSTNDLTISRRVQLRQLLILYCCLKGIRMLLFPLVRR